MEKDNTVKYIKKYTLQRLFDVIEDLKNNHDFANYLYIRRNKNSRMAYGLEFWEYNYFYIYPNLNEIRCAYYAYIKPFTSETVLDEYPYCCEESYKLLTPTGRLKRNVIAKAKDFFLWHYNNKLESFVKRKDVCDALEDSGVEYNFCRLR